MLEKGKSYVVWMPAYHEYIRDDTLLKPKKPINIIQIVCTCTLFCLIICKSYTSFKKWENK